MNNKEWYQQNKERLREYKANNMRKYRSENPEKYRKQSRDNKAKLRSKIYEIYGSVCSICGFDDKRALTLDHINGNGNVERSLYGERGVYKKATLKPNHNEYRILCMNCQFIERSKCCG